MDTGVYTHDEVWISTSGGKGERRIKIAEFYEKKKTVSATAN